MAITIPKNVKGYLSVAGGFLINFVNKINIIYIYKYR